jgi:hypothetical protein
VARWLRFLVVILLAALFIAVTVLLARAFTVDGAERTAIEGLLAAEAGGDATGMQGQILGCAQSPECRARVQADAAALERPGKLVILELNPSAGFSLGSTTGTARVVWRAGTALPIVQCVLVRRAGNVIKGLHVQLLKISRRINTSSDCPSSY